MNTFISHPFRFDNRGRTATSDFNEHVREMIRQVLFTHPGERVNRPDFGSGLRQLVFMPNSDALATATEFIVRGSLDRWLSDVIEIHDVQISHNDGRLVIDIQYSLLADRTTRDERFTSPPLGIDVT